MESSTTPSPHATVVDVHRELGFWRNCYAAPDSGRPPFDDSEPTLKFAYDEYLLHPHEPLDARLDELAQRYARLPRNERLDWPQAEQIIRDVWHRITLR